MQGPSRFGLYLLTLFSACILVLKIITKEQWFLGTWLYTDLSAVATLFAFLVSMTIVMIIGPHLQRVLFISISFLLTFVVVYFILTSPAYSTTKFRNPAFYRFLLYIPVRHCSNNTTTILLCHN